jgi:hypothetical protein
MRSLLRFSRAADFLLPCLFRTPSSRLLKNGASSRDPALCGFRKCSHMNEYAALSKTPHALADGPMLVFHNTLLEFGNDSTP